MQENIEKEVVELHHFEHEDVIHQNTSLEIINLELFDCQKDILHIQKVIVAFEVFQECTNVFPAMNDKEYKQMDYIPLENDIEFNEMEQQLAYKNEGILIIFSDHQQEVILHGIEDPYASMLQSLEKKKIAQFMDCGV